MLAHPSLIRVLAVRGLPLLLAVLGLHPRIGRDERPIAGVTSMIIGVGLRAIACDLAKYCARHGMALRLLLAGCDLFGIAALAVDSASDLVAGGAAVFAVAID
jgi:hypothetical protein